MFQAKYSILIGVDGTPVALVPKQEDKTRVDYGSKSKIKAGSNIRYLTAGSIGSVSNSAGDWEAAEKLGITARFAVQVSHGWLTKEAW